MKKVFSGGQTVGASETLTQIGHVFALTTHQEDSFRADIYVGKVAGSVVMTLQTSTAHDIWTTAKTGTASASTDKTVSGVNTTTGLFTATGHGFSANQAITLNSSGTVPTGFYVGQIYYVEVASSSTFYLHKQPSSIRIIPSDAGTGTITATGVSLVQIVIKSVDSADFAVTPLQRSMRLCATTDSGESCQVLELWDNA